MDDYLKTNIKIIEDKTIDKELKLFCILDLLHHNEISLHKAYELCTEVELFSDHWIVVDEKLTNIWEKYYEVNMNEGEE